MIGHRVAFILLLCSLLIVGPVLAFEGISAGMGLDASGNSAKIAAAGGSLILGFEMNPQIALGLKSTFSYDFNSLTTLEQAGFFRWYPAFKTRGFFLQGELGSSIFYDNTINRLSFMGGLALGWRFHIKKWFLEPGLRAGYPYIWGAGFTAGMIFPISHKDLEEK